MQDGSQSAPSLLQQVRAHAKARDSIAWSGQARQLLLWAADTIEAANAALRSETAAQEKQAVWDMLLLSGDCSDHTLKGAAKLRRILDDLIDARNAAPPKSGAHLVSKQALQEMLSRAEMAAEVTLPIEQFRDLVLQAMEAT